MSLRGQRGCHGYAMAALLVALGVMSVLMTAALPAWRFHARREKEAELVFRGEQYARAIALWERKMGPGTRPPTLDALVQQRFIRKKYKDPMTADGEFQPLYMGVNPTPGIGTGRGQRNPQSGQAPGPPPTSVGRGFPGGQQPGAGGIIGVQSKSKEASIRIYNGRTHYNEWQFIFAGLSNQPGGRGGRGIQQRPGMPPAFPGQGGEPFPRGGPGRGRGPGRGDGRGQPMTVPGPGGGRGIIRGPGQ